MIEEYIKLGKINKLEVYKEVEFGVYLKSKEEGDEVLLPKRYVKDVKIGDIIEVFVYSDSEDRYVATTDKPFAILGEFGIFEVVDTSEFGAFVEWGLPKHLFVPLSTQKRKLKKGDKVIGVVKYDEKTDRLFLDAKITRNLTKASGFNKNDEVDIFVIAKTPLGYKVIVNNQFEGMIFKNEIFKDIQIGQKTKGYIKQNREDGKLDISLRGIGKVKDEAYEILKEYIKTNDLKLTPKSSANEIYEVLGISKKAFKNAYNRLLKEK
jgi:predicted RNA-binding protein (virulence factor B family)